MGEYLNPSGENFAMSLNSKIYVDKSGLIAHLNSLINTEQRFLCVSRPRRFGKTMAAKMMAAYYCHQLEADSQFGDLEIARDPSYATHKNKYDVIMLNMHNFLTPTETMAEMITLLQKEVIGELREQYPGLDVADDELAKAMGKAWRSSGRKFILIIDEWDCLIRMRQDNIAAQKEYLDFLRFWLKDRDYIALAYMTGILPVKKYGLHSALNMFVEYSMTDPGELAQYFGFTDAEVLGLCDKHGMPFEEVKAWYDGYHLHGPISDEAVSIYSPRSVVEALRRKKLFNYWNQTETYEALKIYIDMDYDGLKEAVVTMLAGGSITVNPFKFTNDMTTFDSRDDILTLLVHLGYLNFDPAGNAVAIPNKEVRTEYVNSISSIGWNEVMKQINNANRLLDSLWDMDAEAIARSMDEAHNEVSILQYNDENALSYVINLAFFTAREYYTVIRELPSGKGFADICFVPRRKFADKAAVLIELKWDKSARGALDQIKAREYAGALNDYKQNLLLVGINYDRASKTHECEIERYEH